MRKDRIQGKIYICCNLYVPWEIATLSKIAHNINAIFHKYKWRGHNI